MENLEIRKSAIRIVWFKPWVKYPGMGLMLMGVLGLYFFGYQGIKPVWLQLNVFSFYSQFLATHVFSFINNNQGDEISALTYFLGAFLWLTSAEKEEISFFSISRIKALAVSLLVFGFSFCVGYMFFHGMAVITFTLALPFFIPPIYFILFHFFKQQYKN
jgi:hypothetical protein